MVPAASLQLAALLLLTLGVTASAMTHDLPERPGRRLQGGSERPGAAIVNGEAAPRGRYTYMTSLRQALDDFPFCGGTLIHERIVMTAGHCVVNATTGKRVDKRFHPNVRIGGYWATQDKAGVDYDARTAVYTVPHPRFKTGYSTASPNWLSYDITLIVLDYPSSKTLPRLPPFTAKPDLPLSTANGYLTAIGWGRNVSDVRNGTDRLMQTALKFLTLEECALYYFPLAFDETWNTQICAGNPLSFNSAVCLGDSGGPNLVPSPNGRPANDTIIGITSFAGGKCTGAPAGLTNVAQLRNWIDGTIRQLLGGSWVATWANRGACAWRRWHGLMLLKRVRAALLPTPCTTDSAAAPLTRGFDNSTAVFSGSSNQLFRILSSPTYELQGQLARCPGCSALLPPALVLLRLWREGLQAAVALEGGAAWAYFGGKRYGPGSSPVRVGTDGWIRYPVVQPGGHRIIQLVLPGLSIRAVQPYAPGLRAYKPWLDLVVGLNGLPPLPLVGTLGATFVPPQRDGWQPDS